MLNYNLYATFRNATYLNKANKQTNKQTNKQINK